MKSAYDFKVGDRVRLTGTLGTPSQKRGVWVILDASGFERVLIHRLEDKYSVIGYKACELDHASPLEALAMQAD